MEEKKWKEDKDEEDFFLDFHPSLLRFPENSFAIDHETSWKNPHVAMSTLSNLGNDGLLLPQLDKDDNKLNTTRSIMKSNVSSAVKNQQPSQNSNDKPPFPLPSIMKTSTFSSVVNQDLQQSRNDEDCCGNNRAKTKTYGTGRIERDDCSNTTTSRPSYKRSRIDESTPFNNVNEENEEASKLELYTIQLFTLILAKFNKASYLVGDYKDDGDDYFIISSFQKLKDIILNELNHIEKVLVKGQKRYSDQKPNAKIEQSYSSFTLFDESTEEGEKEGVHERKDYGEASDPLNWKVDVELSTSKSLFKLNNMLFLLLGYISPKVDLNIPHYYITPDYGRYRLTRERNVLTKSILDLIKILHLYNEKRYDQWKTNFQINQEHAPFYLTEAELHECFTMIQRALFQVSYALMIYLSNISEDDFTVTSIIEFFSMIDSSIGIMQSLESSWISKQKSPTRNVNLLDLIITTISTTKQICIQNTSNVQLEQQFNNLITRILPFLHTSPNQNTYSILSSCAEIVFHQDDEVKKGHSTNGEIVYRNYELLLRLSLSIQKLTLVVTTKEPNWRTLFDALNNILNSYNVEVKKALIICNYLARSKTLRAHLISHLPLLTSIMKYTSHHGLSHFNEVDMTWINTKAIRILSFLLATNLEQSIFHTFIDIASLNTSMTVKVEFVLGIEIVRRQNLDFLEKFLETSEHEKLKSFYNVYSYVASYQGASFHSLSYGRQIALRSLCNLSWSSKSEPSLSTCARHSIESILDLGRSYEQGFIQVLSQNIMTQKAACQVDFTSFVRDSTILSRLGKIAIDSSHTYQTKERAMLFMKHLSKHEAVLEPLAMNVNVVNCIMYYLTFHGRNKKAVLMRYCALELSVKMAASTACRKHLHGHRKLLNLWIDAANKLSVHFESYLDSPARAKANIEIPSDEKNTMKRRLERSLSCFV